MSYQVLARKWRPKVFSELVGQEHVVRALSNALDSGRLHHAFLFTGTRGVGKTTIARIFAKSLNCEHGVSSQPCGACHACLDIDAGRFVDLIEIDAASNTGVDNVRDLIENAQYAPSRGQYKVYLIDEVHMLSKSAFNALLKTLEEPPPHVKFLLATTDPQKLPVTVLSRCLQFSLKRLSPEQISGQIFHILQYEQINSEKEAVAELARAADGSLRDGLSLLDQAIAYGGGNITAREVRAMLGTIEHAEVFGLLEAVQNENGAALLAETDRLAEFSPDFAILLDDLAALLHRLQLKQLVPDYQCDDYRGRVSFERLAQTLNPEEVQLYYQLAIHGRRDLSLAPSPRIGFEMTLLRMLAFRPLQESEITIPAVDTAKSTQRATGSGTPSLSKGAESTDRTSVNLDKKLQNIQPVTENAFVEEKAVEFTDWSSLIEAAGLRGPVGQLAQHAAFIALENTVLRLALKPVHEHFHAPPLVTQMEQQISKALDRPIKVRFEKTQDTIETPADMTARAKSAQQQAAESVIEADTVVQALKQEFGARIIPNSIKPLED